MVLGIGTAATVAAWTDNEFGTSAFTASTFGTQSSVNAGSTWADNNVAPGATMTFNATAMSPGSINYALFQIRTTSATNVAGSAQLNTLAASGTPGPGGPTGGLTATGGLEYRAVTVAGTTCDSSAFTAGSTYVVGTNTTWVAATSSASVSATTQSLQAASGNTANYCFVIRLPSGAAGTFQGSTATLTWGWLSTSVS